MMNRFQSWIWVVLVALDQLIHAVGFGAWYVITGRGELPNPDETISSRVGRNAIRGKQWALVMEWLIDSIFELLGQSGHCRANIEWDEK